jgi:hypothetical protein
MTARELIIKLIEFDLLDYEVGVDVSEASVDGTTIAPVSDFAYQPSTKKVFLKTN